MYRSDDPVQDAIKYIEDCDNYEESKADKCEFCGDETDTPKFIFVKSIKRNVKCCTFCLENAKALGESLEDTPAKYMKK